MSEGMYPLRDHSIKWLSTGLSIAIKMTNLKPSHIGNSHHVRYKAVFDVKLLAMALEQYLMCQIFPLQWAHFSVETYRITQWVHLLSMDFNDFSTISFFSLKVHF